MMCEQCNNWPEGMEPESDSVSVSHHPYCPFAPVGKPSWKKIIPYDGDIGHPSDTATFDGTYPPRLSDKGDRIAGHKNPPPPGSNPEGKVD